MGKDMKITTFNALEGMIQTLFESAVSNVQEIINETEDIDFFASEDLINEADYIDKLQTLKYQLDYAEESDKVDELEPNLNFLRGHFQKVALYEMVDEGEVDIIWNMIYPTKAHKSNAIIESITK